MTQALHIAVLSENWLATSETFILRQVQALDEYKIPSVILTQNKMRTSSLDLDARQDREIFEVRKKRIQYWKKRFEKLTPKKENYFEATPKQKQIWKKALVEHKINLIHAHYGYCGLSILPVAKALHLPLITTFHGNDASRYLRDKRYIQSLKALSDYGFIIVVSEFMKQRLIDVGVNPAKIICHYIGTDLSQFPYTEHRTLSEKVKNREPVQFLQVSNFVEKKGHIFTIKAFRNFLKTYPDAKLILAGDGILKKKMEEFVKKSGIENKVHFLGKVGPHRVSELMKSSDIFLHHSITCKNGSQEGIPTVLMEAMASGILVVSTCHAGIPELIENNISGFLVKEKDVTGYTETLIRLLKTDTKSLSNRAFQRINKDFNIKIQNEKLIRIYYCISEGFR